MAWLHERPDSLDLLSKVTEQLEVMNLLSVGQVRLILLESHRLPPLE